MTMKELMLFTDTCLQLIRIILTNNIIYEYHSEYNFHSEAETRRLPDTSGESPGIKILCYVYFLACRHH
jgi:hypothetical protein